MTIRVVDKYDSDKISYFFQQGRFRVKSVSPFDIDASITEEDIDAVNCFVYYPYGFSSNMSYLIFDMGNGKERSFYYPEFSWEITTPSGLFSSRHYCEKNAEELLVSLLFDSPGVFKRQFEDKVTSYREKDEDGNPVSVVSLSINGSVLRVKAKSHDIKRYWAEFRSITDIDDHFDKKYIPYDQVIVPVKDSFFYFLINDSDQVSDILTQHAIDGTHPDPEDLTILLDL